jgi:hypothetical protein
MTAADRSERVNRQLREMGCPYPTEDVRSSAWLEGFAAARELVNRKAEPIRKAQDAWITGEIA